MDWGKGEDTIKNLNLGEQPVCKSAEFRNERGRNSLNQRLPNLTEGTITTFYKFMSVESTSHCKKGLSGT